MSTLFALPRASLERWNYLAFVTALLRHRLADFQTIEQRLEFTPLDPQRRALIAARLRRFAGTT